MLKYENPGHSSGPWGPPVVPCWECTQHVSHMYVYITQHHTTHDQHCYDPALYLDLQHNTTQHNAKQHNTIQYMHAYVCIYIFKNIFI